MSEKKINKIYLPLLFAVVLIAGFILGGTLSKNNSNHSSSSYRGEDKLLRIIDYIEQRYVDTVSREALENAAIPALLEELDPHSVYIPASEMKRVSEDLRGNFEGIGVVFNHQTDTAIIINVISGGPSDRAGVLAGDRIIRVNDSLVAGQNIPSNDLVGMLKGEMGTKVKISLERKGVPELIDVEIIRDKIPIYSVDVAYMINDEIGYIKINRFAETTFKEFLEGIEKLQKKNFSKLIIDLRGNNGGYMVAATNIVDQFLDEDKLIVYTEGKASPRQEIYSTSRGMCKDIEVVVLQDEWAASASEILSGAIQDNDRGTIIGRRSFGKGLVQEAYPLSDGSVIRLTIARYYTPTGRSIQKPYGDDKMDYYNDIYNRFQNGEFEVADSIHFADSLKYTTPEGKVVFGGGGIMPDIFVPIDTTGYSKYFSQILQKGILQDFTFNYADENRKNLNQYETAREISDYLESVRIFDQFIAYASQHGVPTSVKGFDKSAKIVDTQVRALIARNIIDNDGYYPIIGEIDRTLNVAVKFFEKK
ncbi:MAG: S41 family peptidase [Bacteroidales bacterium]|jgi:carboxyl-terminal processing protease|nr:S41 family peptidase [Bacteroidales bacterium]